MVRCKVIPIFENFLFVSPFHSMAVFFFPLMTAVCVSLNGQYIPLRMYI